MKISRANWRTISSAWGTRPIQSVTRDWPERSAMIVQTARASSRVLMTLDKGVASLLQYPVNEHGGVVLFRPDASGRRSVLTFVRLRLSSLLDMELAGRLTIVGHTRIRVR